MKTLTVCGISSSTQKQVVRALALALAWMPVSVWAGEGSVFHSNLHSERNPSSAQEAQAPRSKVVKKKTAVNPSELHRLLAATSGPPEDARSNSDQDGFRNSNGRSGKRDRLAALGGEHRDFRGDRKGGEDSGNRGGGDNDGSGNETGNRGGDHNKTPKDPLGVIVANPLAADDKNPKSSSNDQANTNNSSAGEFPSPVFGISTQGPQDRSGAIGGVSVAASSGVGGFGASGGFGGGASGGGASGSKADLLTLTGGDKLVNNPVNAGNPQHQGVAPPPGGPTGTIFHGRFIDGQ